jgi:hypothetical protein
MEWRTRNNEEMDNILRTEDRVRFVKARRISWIGHVERMKGSRMRKRVMREKIYTRRKRGRPKVRWLDDVQEDLWAMGIEGWSTRGQGSRRAVETGGGGCGSGGCRFQRLRGQSTSFNLLFVVDSTTTDSMEQSPS